MAAPRTHDTGGAGSAADARVRAMLARHGAVLLRVARQASICEDDALDAVQRGLEIYVRRLDTVERATEAAWLKVVVRHEAYAIRHSRADTAADPELQPDVPATDRSVEEQVLSSERVSRSAEALRALKPDEARALMLKAHGLSYEEIGRRCGWTYTKVNRCITEGRRRFLETYAGLESGVECERFAPALAALASGAATSEQLVELRPHLRHCGACRATVRDLHLARGRTSLLLPWIGVPLEWLRERFGVGRTRGRELPVLDRPDGPLPEPSLLERVHRDATALLHRAHGSDFTTNLQWLTSLGGGRTATVGAILGLCLSSLGAGTVCVVTGVIDLGLDRPAPKTVQHRHRAAPVHVTTREPAPPKLAAMRPTATPTPAPTPARREQTQTSNRAADLHASGPDRAQQEFGFEPNQASQPVSSQASTSQASPASADAVEQEFGP